MLSKVHQNNGEPVCKKERSSNRRPGRGLTSLTIKSFFSFNKLTTRKCFGSYLRDRISFFFRLATPSAVE